MVLVIPKSLSRIFLEYIFLESDRNGILMCEQLQLNVIDNPQRVVRHMFYRILPTNRLALL